MANYPPGDNTSGTKVVRILSAISLADHHLHQRKFSAPEYCRFNFANADCTHLFIEFLGMRVGIYREFIQTDFPGCMTLSQRIFPYPLPI
jgi:hypothetical protein